MKTWLLDTGPVVAYIDRHDPWHAQVTSVLDPFKGKLLTTSAIVVESMHLLSDVRDGPEMLFEFMRNTAIQILECTDLQQLADAVILMKKYGDVPMDFADASLILLGDRMHCYEICTLDQRGFTTFRSPKGKHFSLMIEQSGRLER